MNLLRRAKRTTYKAAMATVTSCHYEFGAGQALAFGIPKARHFQITFNYWVDGELHTGEFASAKAMPQGTLFRITYNSEAPHENSKAEPTRVPPLFVLVIIGIVILFALSTAMFHGCNALR